MTHMPGTTVFAARRVITMDPDLPEATAVAVSGGRAVLATTALADGTHKLSAQFVPGSGFGASSSTATTFVVRVRTTKTTVSASPRTVKKGKTVTPKDTGAPGAAAKGDEITFGVDSAR